jgi:MFS transporter, DHA3 family, macrolide efflux protein
MMSLGDYATSIAAPFLGGILVSSIGVGGVMLVDITTFLFAVGSLLIVRIPQPERTEGDEARPLWRDSFQGFQYIAQRRGLMMLMFIGFTFSLSESLAYPLITPFILARTGDEVLLGTIRAVQGIGGVLGGVLLGIWGGPKRRIHGVLIGIALTGLLGDALMGIGHSAPVWLLAAFLLEFFIPVAIGSYHAIWHSKVAPALQGRVFAARDIIATMGEPVAMLFAGLTVDNLLEPAMMSGGGLANTFGWLVGTGAGAGMALLLILGGVMASLAGLSGYLFWQVRDIEIVLPDHDVEMKPATQVGRD